MLTMMVNPCHQVAAALSAKPSPTHAQSKRAWRQQDGEPTSQRGQTLKRVEKCHRRRLPHVSCLPSTLLSWKMPARRIPFQSGSRVWVWGSAELTEAGSREHRLRVSFRLRFLKPRPPPPPICHMPARGLESRAERSGAESRAPCQAQARAPGPGPRAREAPLSFWTKSHKRPFLVLRFLPSSAVLCAALCCAALAAGSVLKILVTQAKPWTGPN